MCNTEEQNSQQEATYFLKLLEKVDNAVLIPKIQRDYVQGGKNAKAEDIRHTFVEDLCGAVNGEKNLLLDFIYGIAEKDKQDCITKFYPLDGQQRLTTLFLLHWYGSLFVSNGEEIRKQLKKFSYQTRFSSEQFCKLLFKDSVINNIQSNGSVPVSSVITDDPGYSKFWKYDPTVDSMLTMLDCIQEKAREINWDEKIENLNNIKFFLFEIEDSQEPDELYVKMNARGKHLTNFENMKAHLQQWMPSPSEGLPEEFKKDWQKKMDADWSEFFWKNKDIATTDNLKKNPDPARDFIDAPFWVFLNRLSLWGYITKKKDLLEPLRKKASDRNEDEEKDATAFSDALSKLSMPQKDTYVSPSMQKEIFANNPAMYKIVSNTLNLISGEKIKPGDLYPLWDKAEKSFREFFWKNGSTLNTRIQIFAFAAFCNSFCNDSELNEEHLKHWMQFVHQVCANLNDEQAFAGAASMVMICLEAMGKQSDVYAYLAEKYEEQFNKKEDSTLPLTKWHFSIKDPVKYENNCEGTIYYRLFQKNQFTGNGNTISFQSAAIWHEALKCYLRYNKHDQNAWNSLLQDIEGHERLHGHIQGIISENDSDEELFKNTSARFDNFSKDNNYFSAHDERFVELLQLTTESSLKMKFDFSSYAKWHSNVIGNPTIAEAMCKFLSGEKAEGAEEWQKMLQNTKNLITEWKSRALEPYRKDGLMHLMKGGNIASGSIILNPAVHETIKKILENEEIKTFTLVFKSETIDNKTFYICDSPDCVLVTITYENRCAKIKTTLKVELTSRDEKNITVLDYKNENQCKDIKNFLLGNSETLERSESVSVAEEQNS